jgi:hypothetical protein
MDITAMRPMCQRDPDGVNYHTRYPVAKGVRDYFAQNVVRAVDVGIEAASTPGAKQPTLDARASVDLMLSDGFEIKEAAPGGVALLSHDDPYAHQFRLVAQDPNEASVRHKYEVLVGAPPQHDLLFPSVVFANDQRTYALLDEPIDDAAARDVQVRAHLARPFVG